MLVELFQKARDRTRTHRMKRRFGHLFAPLADAASAPGCHEVLTACIGWLRTAQDHSRSCDGGVARGFSALTGWGTSYPETTGYILATLLDCAGRCRYDDLESRARDMLNWLVKIQLDGGGYPGGTIDRNNGRPVTFNTGQVLIGLARGARHFGDSAALDAMHRTARFLVGTQDAAGYWDRNLSPYTVPGPKAYHTHVALGLLEAARAAPDAGYAEAALANVQWALSRQRPNGWFADCCISHPGTPLTHTLGYTLRGVVEACRFTQDPVLLDACRRCADGLAGALREDGFLPGRLDASWRAAADWVCLTGSAQVAESLLLLHRLAGEPRYLEGGRRINAYLRRLVNVDGPPEIRGAVPGAWPFDAPYERNCFPNWACKFFVDSLLLERAHESGAAGRTPAAATLLVGRH